MTTLIKSNLFLIGIIVIAIFLRFLFLGEVPNGIFNDELTYLLISKSIIISGSDITGTWSPLSLFLFHYPPGGFQTSLIQAELPYLLFLPAIWLFGLTMFGAFVTNAVAGVALVIVIYLLTKRSLGKEVALIASFFTTINPWLIVSSRSAYESIYAVLFYLIAIYIMLIAKRWYILLALPFFLLAFYSYIATKLIFLPLIFITCLYGYFFVNHKKYGLQYIILCVVSTLFSTFFFFAQLHSGSRIAEVLSINNPYINQQVNSIRETSIANPLVPFFTNKVTFFFSIILTKLFKTFSFDYLFISGDSFFAIWRHGLFYIIDAIFLLIGIPALYLKQRKLFWLLLSLIGISVVPQLFHSTDVNNFTPHIALLIPLFLIVMAYGLWQVVNVKILKKYTTYFLSGMICIYFLFTVNFFIIYLFQNPIVGNFYDFPSRVLAQYILQARKTSRVIVYTNLPTELYKKYIFYTDGLNKSSLGKVRQSIINPSSNFTLQNIQFTSCPTVRKPLVPGTTAIYNLNCNLPQQDKHHVSIVQITDGGEVYGIYNDSLCVGDTLERYPTDIHLSYFQPEKSVAKDFCKKYIMKVR